MRAVDAQDDLPPTLPAGSLQAVQRGPISVTSPVETRRRPSAVSSTSSPPSAMPAALPRKAPISISAPCSASRRGDAPEGARQALPPPSARRGARAGRGARRGSAPARGGCRPTVKRDPAGNCGRSGSWASVWLTLSPMPSTIVRRTALEQDSGHLAVAEQHVVRPLDACVEARDVLDRLRGRQGGDDGQLGRIATGRPAQQDRAQQSGAGRRLPRAPQTSATRGLLVACRDRAMGLGVGEQSLGRLAAGGVDVRRSESAPQERHHAFRRDRVVHIGNPGSLPPSTTSRL